MIFKNLSKIIWCKNWREYFFTQDTRLKIEYFKHTRQNSENVL